MDFIQTANKQADKFGTGKHGFSAGNPSGGIPATYMSSEWCDNIQQEIVNVIEGAGGTINPASKTQLYQAIQAMITGQAANDYKASVRAATTANITTLAGGAPNTLDGVTLVANDRILVKDQTTGSQNGIYMVTTLGTGANGTWTRATDADQAGELTSGAVVAVEEGTTNADSQWMLTTDGAITIGTTALTWARKDGANGLDTTRIDVASAATVDLTANAPSTRNINITGTIDISAFMVAAGRTYFVRFAASLTLTNGASIVTQTGANIVTQAGDTCILRATAANVVEVLSYVPAKNASQPGAAPVFGLRGWAKVDGTLAGTNAPTAGGNIASVTRNIAGNYTATFVTAMPDANYSYVGICPGNGPLLVVVPQAQTASSFTFNTQAPANGALADVSPIFLMVTR